MKKYLGDGLYAEDDGVQVRLYTERVGGVHEVYLDGSVLRELLRFIEESRQVRINVTVLPEDITIPPGGCKS